ncbi:MULTISPECIES: immunoglobulin-like domain-containing protein [Catenuloplanes]|uniref:Atrophied bacterial Ig domain-containing protein n=1 Tax=Catenuloplanes niger TaxID=587534 RepID=A0AAE4CY33_9ACTN|nr:immunoglobulin-like domain-containing protein [Catenuloplanes niger]MDR7328077.1 hypothetical protein [Catenuloplanes niger]
MVINPGRAATASLLAPLLLAVPVPAVAAPGAGPLLHYRLTETTSGAVAVDSSGHGRHGTVSGAAAWGGAQGLAFDGTSTFVSAPADLMAGLDAITVSFDVRVDPAQATPYFLYGFGNTAGAHGNGYLFATGDHLRTAITAGNWSGEQNTRRDPAHRLPRGVWKHVTYTQAGGVGVLYQDGTEIGRNTAVTVTPGAIGGGSTTANYLGRSLYAADRLFHGAMRDFRVYDRALDRAEVAELARPYNEELVAGALTLGDTTGLTADLALPATNALGAGVAWTSSDPSVITDRGVVTRPAPGAPAGRAELTAVIGAGPVSRTVRFRVSVRPLPRDRAAVTEAAAALTVHDLDEVRGNLTLPATGLYGTGVSWRSSDPAVITPTGEVRRGRHVQRVRLTATVTRGDARTRRTFLATVLPRPRQEPLAGYLFSYFTGEGTADGEQVHFALSRGNDPLHWDELNGGAPVLTSTLGERGLRDPFIIRSPEGDKFYQIATDLRIYGNGDWDAAQRHGSRSIMVWESVDLVHWTDQRLVQVSPETAGNTWAPEAYYDTALGAYVVFWASKLYAADDPQHTGASYNRMMYATTRDFHTFSTPAVWKDPGYSVIDSTVVRDGDTYYRFTKDERNPSSTTPCSKFIIAERSAALLDPEWDLVAECIGSGALARGEGPLVFRSNTERKWYLFIDEFGGRGYVPFETTDLASGVWTVSADYALPARPRHGTVLPVTATEYAAVRAAYSAGS